MTPKEQQLADHVLDLALGARNPGDLQSLVTTYIRLKLDFEVFSPVNRPESEPFKASDLPPVSFEEAFPNVEAATEASTVANAVNEAVATPAKTRKPRATKPETPASEPELPPTPEPETVETEVVDPAEDSAEPDKTYAEKIAEGQAAYMAHFKELTDDDAAQRAFRASTTDLAKKHGGERISKVPEENIDAFLADLQGLIAASQPV